MSTAYLGLGSNIEARKNIPSAIEALRQTFARVDLSPVYQTVPFGFEGEDFINLVARVETGMSPLELKAYLHALEDRHQRNRSVPKFSDRTLDIDILLYDDLYVLSPELELPRVEILEAAYVLKPLADLAPKLRHPVERITMSELWSRFPGKTTVMKPISL
ncbi:MAG: 2-amino-4-hydroxy-6-hydroxymethyldihydropteridine diphosphokinase [Xanthomonadales bacterium]|nr:2-amino-4-hydroxy-6-hydroxymethyldihydropteridine diphosphokinase [Gammaproteobacteria bacterium]MBT8052844.1 2-amino-4-hydroxy-6-hydroxymethyldihydropteridine diphosphokinase [Gammaproteobacteria bacterium]NND55695.1 2-amino-4-hydroxy-6-hydroxymethyldihydropteridine diphosphokinase [Xanthomonadales bacterium]NNK50006.1 2-amino-4-hydroxy-6-hydroxymethyldihydropteridine diphosphokinase [Xanthomonadales bacterium]